MAKKKYRIVFIVACKDEIPVDWIESTGVDIITMRSVQLKSIVGLGASSGNTEILFFITGIGLKAARRAALWICENLDPLFVVNIGTAGAVGDISQSGVWITPSLVCDEDGNRIKIDQRLPFPFTQERSINGSMVSVRRPIFGDWPENLREHGYVDMEVFALAQEFGNRNIPFHTVKMITDDSGVDAEKNYRQALGTVREGMKKALSFLKTDVNRDVSVIIPVYNRKERIVECVESVLAQSVPAHEIIVVDDGSTDGTPEALKVFGDSIKVITLDENRGVSCARNVGVKKATGEWIAFLDSDDQWTEKKLECQLKFIESNRFYEIVQSEEVWIRNGKRVNPRHRHTKPEGWIFEPSLKLCIVSPSTALIKKSLLEAYGGFDESLPACEDYDLWLRLSRHHPVGLEGSMTTIKHGGHEDQLSRKYEAMDRFRVKALTKALDSESDPACRKEITEVLQEKLNILLQGSLKRDLHEKIEEYETALAALDS